MLHLSIFLNSKNSNIFAWCWIRSSENLVFKNLSEKLGLHIRERHGWDVCFKPLLIIIRLSFAFISIATNIVEHQFFQGFEVNFYRVSSFIKWRHISKDFSSYEQHFYKSLTFVAIITFCKFPKRFKLSLIKSVLFELRSSIFPRFRGHFWSSFEVYQVVLYIKRFVFLRPIFWYIIDLCSFYWFF